jgi:lycopene epsilon-cyclase
MLCLCRLVTLASGQAAGRFLKYEAGAPTVAAQTAYGIEAEVEGYNDAYDSASMLFMDYRRHHSGLWDGAARHLEPGGFCNGFVTEAIVFNV